MNTAISIDQEITNYLPQLNTKQKKTVLTVVKTFMNEQKDWWDEISAQQQELIDNALAEVNAGKLISHDEVMRKYSKWIKK